MLDHLAGEVEHVRSLTPCERKPAITHPGQPLTRKRCREVWGHLLDYLPTRAEERIRACGGFKDKKRFVPYSKNLRFELGMVTYNGSGKYRQNDVVAPWNAIPEDEGALHQQGQQNTIPPFDLEQIASWWPVVCVHDDAEGTITMTAVCGGWIIVICIYQLMWDVPSAWSVRVIPLSRM